MNASDWERAKALLAEAAERPAAEREQYVIAHCADAELRREVLAMLAAPAPISDIVAAGALRAGQRLGAYVVGRAIGHGGMGEVYRARDSRLGRDVAIKVLPPAFSADAGRLARFEREARILASLNHPHICTLFDVGRDDGIDYLVMELVEGESLADRIARGPLPLRDVLRYGMQIADALDKAHARGIVHRDLKPGNVMLTRAGAKLLDFGLARSTAAGDVAAHDASLAGASRSATPLTAEGAIVGTRRYMAPEQIEGAEADARSDIWALGCVLYEMVTGTPAFDGRTPASLTAAILDHHPIPPAGAVALPPAFEHVVRRCLAKSAEDRWQSAADVRHELAWIAESGVPPAAPSIAPVFSVRERLAWGVATVALVALAAASAGIVGRRADSARPEMRLNINPPGQIKSVAGFLALSADGQHVAFVARSAGGASPAIWVRSLDALDARKLPSTDGLPLLPFWSPDGKSIGFFADGKLKRIDLASGVVQVICDAPAGRGGAWGPDGTIVFTPDRGLPLFRVASRGGAAPARVTELAASPAETSHRLPSFLPDGRHFVFTITGADGWYGIALGSLDSTAKVELLKWRADQRSPFETTQAYVSHGFLLFTRAGSLLAQRLDERRWVPTGDAVPVASRVDEDDMGLQAFAVSPAGPIVYRAVAELPAMHLALLTRGGRVRATLWESAELDGPSFAPDGRRVAVARVDHRTNGSDIWIVDVLRNTASRLTSALYAEAPRWSSDGARVLFSVARDLGREDIYAIPADGSGPAELVLESPAARKWPLGWSADGALLFAASGSQGFGYGLWSLPRGRDRQPAVLFNSDAHTRFFDADVSPDGRFVAYAVDGEIDIQSLPSGPRLQVASNGATTPRWRADGTELYYASKDKLMAAELRRGATIDIGRVKPLFDRPDGPVYAQYAVSADGDQFLFRVPDGPVRQSSIPLTLVLNWTEGLGR